MASGQCRVDEVLRDFRAALHPRSLVWMKPIGSCLVLGARSLVGLHALEQLQTETVFAVSRQLIAGNPAGLSTWCLPEDLARIPGVATCLSFLPLW